MNDLHDLELLLRSDTPILLIETLEEPRLIDLVTRLAVKMPEPAFCWTLTDGLRRMDLDLGSQGTLAAPPDVLRHIKSTTQRGIYLLLDFHPFLDDPLHVRLIKEIAQGYQGLPRTLILASHALTMPPELRHLGASFDLKLPDRNRILALIREEAQSWQHSRTKRPFRADREAVDRLSRNLLGVSESDARRLIRNAIQQDGAITLADLDVVNRAKYELLSPGGIVSFEYDTADFADLAGLPNLKEWLDRRRKAILTSKATDRPRGILLLGVQGSGKSLAAKATAGRFGIPLLRLDFATLYDKYIGETEKNLRRALMTADTMAPCVLWLDEIEKGLAAGTDDQGVGQRVMGTLLTWMAERKSAVFIVATANDISRLPPELIRKGRMDEIFFVDLPDREVRARIFEVHLVRRRIDPAGIDLERLAAVSDGFSGAEIEQAVVSALYATQTKDEPMTTQTLLAEIERTQPLSVVMDSQIQQLRLWAGERTVPA